MNNTNAGFLDELIKVARLPRDPEYLGVEEIPEELRREGYRRHLGRTAETTPIGRIKALLGGAGIGAGVGGLLAGVPLGASEAMDAKRLGRGRFKAFMKPVGMMAGLGALFGLGGGALQRRYEKRTVGDAQQALKDETKQDRMFRKERNFQSDYLEDPEDPFYSGRKADIANRREIIEESDLTPEQKGQAIKRVEELRPLVMPQQIIHSKSNVDRLAETLRDMADRSERERDREDRRRRERSSQGR